MAIALAAVAGLAIVAALASLVLAWRASAGHPAFDALGFRKWVIGSSVFQHMPPAAEPYIRRYFVSFIVFFAALIGAGVALVFGAR